jgi:Zn-dependent alcohol dehydrogenase
MNSIAASPAGSRGRESGVGMKTTAAVCRGVGPDWSVEEIDLDSPRAGEVLICLAASGLCHSDEHVLTGDLPMRLPLIGGHEGAGVVEEVGPGVVGLEPGDHVVCGFSPACGRCGPCSTGHQTYAMTLAVENRPERIVEYHAQA